MELILLDKEWTLRALVDLGFGQSEAEVYLFLVINGPQKASAIAEALGTNRQRVYRTLKKLQSLHIVSGTKKLPSRFIVLPFDKTLDLLARDSLEEAIRIEENKNDILALWDYCFKKR